MTLLDLAAGDGGADNEADKELNRLDGLARTGTYLCTSVLRYFDVTLPIQLILLIPSSHILSTDALTLHMTAAILPTHSDLNPPRNQNHHQN